MVADSELAVDSELVVDSEMVVELELAQGLVVDFHSGDKMRRDLFYVLMDPKADNSLKIN